MKTIPVFLVFLMSVFVGTSPIEAEQLSGRDIAMKMDGVECYLGHDWVRGFANAYFDYDPAVRDWTDDNDEIYYVELNEAYLTVDTERIDLVSIF